jgi:hypothetical protein
VQALIDDKSGVLGLTRTEDLQQASMRWAGF